MPFSTDAVANEFLDIAERHNTTVSPMKLQKLVYFAHGWHLTLEPNGKPLVFEKVQVWEYGPVFPSIYHEFKDFGGNPIARRARETSFDGGKIKITTPSLDNEAGKNTADAAFSRSVIKRIWEVYSGYSAGYLSDITHEEGSPWWEVYQKAKKEFGGRIPRGLSIPNKLILTWFKQRFQTQVA